jgi:hypothetical protein
LIKIMHSAAAFLPCPFCKYIGALYAISTTLSSQHPLHNKIVFQTLWLR